MEYVLRRNLENVLGYFETHKQRKSSINILQLSNCRIEFGIIYKSKESYELIEFDMPGNSDYFTGIDIIDNCNILNITCEKLLSSLNDIQLPNTTMLKYSEDPAFEQIDLKFDSGCVFVYESAQSTLSACSAKVPYEIIVPLLKR